ncbi:MAG: hypothetical protein M1825_000915 [Sarcosagium campestre]|nr:MAG: hypothetical protein M1825_000915 [Sarcosagium campestre]
MSPIDSFSTASLSSTLPAVRDNDAGASPEDSSKSPPPTFGHALGKYFPTEPGFVNLNHGSFGTSPHVVLETAGRYRNECENNADKFLRYTYPGLLLESRVALASLLHAPADTVVLVPNATTGINTVLRSLELSPGDRLAYFSTTYPACENTLLYICELTGAKPLHIELQYPISDDDLIAAFRNAIRSDNGGGKVRAALLDSVISMPGLRMPYEALVRECAEADVLSIVDGAHGVGQLDLNLSELNADFFVSNCHKWLFTPRPCAFLHVPKRNQPMIRSSLPTSHTYKPLEPPSGSNLTSHLPPSGESSIFERTFAFVGTTDVSAYVAIPAALKFRRDVCGGEAAIRAYCFQLAREGGRAAAALLGTEVLAEGTSSAECCFANVRLPLLIAPPPSSSSKAAEAVMVVAGEQEEAVGESAERGEDKTDDDDPAAFTLARKDVGDVTNWILRSLLDEHNTFIAISFHAGALWARFSAQVYLEVTDFEYGARVLGGLCEAVKRCQGPSLQS